MTPLNSWLLLISLGVSCIAMYYAWTARDQEDEIYELRQRLEKANRKISRLEFDAITKEYN
jgi:hypothetical protein